MQRIHWHHLTIILATLLYASGCGGSSPAPSPTASGHTGHEEHGAEHHGAHEHADHVHDMMASTDVEEALSQLSQADRALAEKQKICPVTDEPLGSMGVPPKVTINGREVFLCCIGCEEALKDDPETYLAKLPQ